MTEQEALDLVPDCVKVFVRTIEGEVLGNVVIDRHRHLVEPTSLEGLWDVRDMLQQQLNTVERKLALLDARARYRGNRNDGESIGVNCSENKSNSAIVPEWDNSREIYEIGLV